MSEFGRHFRETWHEGITMASGYVVVSAWKAVGFPSVWQLAGGASRVAYDCLRLAVGAD